MELREHPFSEGILDWFEVYLRERGEYAILPVPVGKDSMKVRMIVKCFPSSLYGKDSGELTLVDAEYLRECLPSCAKEYGIELAVVLKEDSQAFRDGKDCMSVWNIFDYFTVDVLPTSRKATSDKPRTSLLA
jgi:hypothetical protein